MLTRLEARVLGGAVFLVVPLPLPAAVSGLTKILRDHLAHFGTAPDGRAPMLNRMCAARVILDFGTYLAQRPASGHLRPPTAAHEAD
jgi:hypothetical protein